MAGGYDRRVSYGKPVPISLKRISTGVKTVGHNFWKKDSVDSYRSNPTGQLLNPAVADPYAYFLQSNAKVQNARAIQQNLLGSEKERVTDNGHSFVVEKRNVVTSHSSFKNSCYGGSTNSTLYVGGPVTAQGAIVSITSPDAPFELQTGTVFQRRQVGLNIPSADSTGLSDRGKFAIAQCSPSSVDVDLPLFVAEYLRDRPYHVGINLYHALTRGEGFIKGSADEFLNLIFGVNPTVKDLHSLSQVLMDFSQRIIQLRRDAGRGVRRTFDFPAVDRSYTYQDSSLESRGVTMMGSAFSYSTGSGDAIAPFSASYRTEVHLRETVVDRFVGSFTYYLPPTVELEDNLPGYLEQINYLVKTQVSREAAWNLVPYSWLIDWAVDISRSLRLADIVADDKLVINYGYMMRHTERSVRQSTTVLNAAVGMPSWSTVHTIYSYSRKQRLRANPFGFIQPSAPEMSPMKWAILGALGLSRNFKF